ncbi:MAG: VOC family protein [Firmicutes bacterium]|nr:VOC family protein [Bacillota bacterium]
MKFNALIPELSVTDIKKSLGFYVRILGFKVAYERPENNFAFLEFQDSQIMLDQLKSREKSIGTKRTSDDESWNSGNLEHPFGRGVNLSIGCDNVEELYAKVSKSKHIFRELETKSYRQGKNILTSKQFIVGDPDGYLLRFSQSISKED